MKASLILLQMVFSICLFGTTYTVNTLGTANTGSGTSGTLRWCINQANLSVGPHTINFSVAGSININASGLALPSLSQAITIDATTAPGYAGTPVVLLTGSSSNGSNGITIAAANCKLYGLDINNFQLSGIQISGDVADNFIIGSSGKGNIIRNSGGYGIVNSGGDNGSIQYSYIGTNATGSICAGNSYYGIKFELNSNFNSILLNVISCNGYDGIYLGSSSNNIIKGNTMGPLSTGCTNNGYRGIKIENNSANNIIGGILPNEGNKISGNTYYGIEVIGSGSTGNTISGNVMNCNDYGGIELTSSGNTNIARPIITSASSAIATGTSVPNATIEIFRDQDLSSIGCSYSPANNQGTDYLGTTIADASGNWALSGAFSGYLVATATLSGNTSEFATRVNTGVTAINTFPCIGLYALPVSLTTFSISCATNGLAHLKWETASEINNQYFTLSRSIDGFLFEDFAVIPGNLTTSLSNSYDYLDIKPQNGFIYYRLSQTDVNGTTTILGNRVWQSNWCEQDQDTAFSFPNPVLQTSSIHIFIAKEDAVFNGGYYDMTGRLILPLQANLHQGWNTISTDLSALSDGNYLLMGTTAKNDKLIREMIVKQ